MSIFERLRKEKSLYDLLKPFLKPDAKPEDIQFLTEAYGVIDRLRYLETVGEIKTIDQINTIKQIEAIEQIHQINEGYVSQEEQVIRNSRFFFLDQFWRTLIGNPAKFEKGCCTLNPVTNSVVCSICQYVIPYFANTIAFLIEAQADSGNPTLYFALHFIDGTFETVTFTLSTSRNFYPYVSRTPKRLRYVSLANSDYENSIKLFNVKGVFIKKEIYLREDVLVKSWNLTSGTTTLLNAVANKRHKVYGWDYECDADGECGFSAVVGGVSVLFGRRMTKGVHSKTLVYPIVCDVNTALSFVSAGNTYLTLYYVTEE